jgi:hypothetical protein
MGGGMQNSLVATTPAARIKLSRSKNTGNHYLREQRINMLQDQEFLANHQKLAQFIFSNNAEAIHEKVQKENLEKQEAASKKSHQSQREKMSKQTKKKQQQVEEEEEEEEEVDEEERPALRKVKNTPNKIRFVNADRGETIESAPEPTSKKT